MTVEDEVVVSKHLTLNLSDSLYDKLRRRAEEAHRTIEEELQDLMAAGLAASEALDPDLEAAVTQLATLDDAALLRAARATLPAAAAEELETLHDKRQREGLTEEEARTAAALTRRYEHSMLVRAEAAALLAQRGHDVSSLLSAA